MSSFSWPACEESLLWGPPWLLQVPQTQGSPSRCQALRLSFLADPVTLVKQNSR